MSEGSISIGDPAPAFELADTEGALHSLPSAAEEEGGPATAATVVVWTCNHCPYALAWHERLVEVAADYADRDVHLLMINSNDAERYPADSLEAMRERHRGEGWPVPYLHDADQSVARAWGAKTTPDVFVLDPDLRLAYRGAPDADHQRPELRAEWLRAALDATLAGREPDPRETDPVGCSIKWRP
ncbi:MAG: thioredoxin family protein [Thermoleophilia bacterium]|nr:thioredoxin family protein [Thermoleophilia bacterium]